MRISATALAAVLLVACGPALAGEDTDFGIAPTRELRLGDYSAPTPREVPGARIIRTSELKALMQRDIPARPVLVDVVGSEGHDSIPGAVWLPGVGRGSGFDDTVQERLGGALEALTARSKARPVVFFCAGVDCWLSYNASLRAVALGYSAVYWYRGGIEAWLDAGGDLQPMRVTWGTPVK